MKKIVISLSLTLTCSLIQSQTYTGWIKDSATNEPLEFVNIGIIGRNIGTVSSNAGYYTINIDNDIYDNDTIKFSFIGYTPLSINVSDYKSQASKDILLNQKSIDLDEIIVQPLNTEEKILGNKYKGKKIQGGFRENDKGFECGVLLKIKKRALLKEFICNIAECTYDSIFYRLNIYKDYGNNSFVNILQKPIYIHKKINNKLTTLTVDLSPYNITVEGNTLVTLEHVSDMGEGKLLFSGGIAGGSTCYFRKKSQSYWEKIPIKLSFSVKAQVEK